jgi:hypothetical protein
MVIRRPSRLVAALALMASSGCVEAPVEQRRAPSTELHRPVSGPGYVGVLFIPLDPAGRSIMGWVPDRSDVMRVEARLPELLAGTPPAAYPQVAAHLDAYRRQYLGQRERGRRILQLSFIERTLIEERNLDWRSQRFLVPDAGRRFFQIWYDLEADRIARFQISSSDRGVRAPTETLFAASRSRLR